MKHNTRWKFPLIGLLFLGALGSSEAQPYLDLQSNHMVVAGGVLKIPGGQITVKSGATMTLHGPSTTIADLLRINAGGLVRGSGILMADVLNYGLLAADVGPGTSLILTGTVTNHGTIRASRGSALVANTAPFNNLGTLDLLTGVEALPALMANSGIIYLLSSAPPLGLTIDGGDSHLSLSAPAGHSYQFQASPDLAAGSWFNLGAPQSGNDGLLTTVHPGSFSFGRFFYRYTIAD
ncbi:MAG: hypothetical protein U0984_08735 [Prosthecobacter sp.]|nr:hypothetical protein [Prosthecobacter sp.]